MKKLLLIVLPLLLIVGCSSPEPINYETTLIERDGVFYTKDTNKPYSGPVFSLSNSGKKNDEGILLNGKKDGLWIGWYENGQKVEEGTYKDGKKDGLWTRWYGDGQKLREGTYKDGEEVGKWTYRYENGQKKREGTYKDGKLNGLWTRWYENGQKYYVRTYKDGKLISSKRWNRDGSVKE